MNKFITIPIITILLAAGCGKSEHPDPPVERVGLAVRFFKSMAKRDAGIAVRQGKNLLALDRSQNNIRTMIAIQESNQAIADAQKLLDEGKVDQALQVIDRRLQEFPDNYALAGTRAKLRQLRNAEKLLNDMKRARNAAAMSGARSAAETGLSQNTTTKLADFFRKYEAKEKKIAALERKNTQASLDAASDAAERAKAEDARREAENLAFMQEMAEKTGESEKMRKEAGGVPFDPSAGSGEKR
ncbi:MAG: hypothetical protein IKC82_07005 [Lentisphaeria bacterium]|nr:hypothetical protein [Lentisphaeria bacterium]